MKAKASFLSAAFILFTALNSIAATFESGEYTTISRVVNDNLYIAGAGLTINAPIFGDLTAAANTLTINDSINEDVLAAAGDILIHSYIGDDATLFGGNVKILADIKGDLIIFGGNVQIAKEVVIEGDLIVFAGQCIMNGKVNGEVRIWGEEVLFNGIAFDKVEIKADKININGIVFGNARLSANEIILEENAKFHDKVDYWQKEGEINFEPFMIDQQAKYDSELQLNSSQGNWKFFGIGILAFWIFYTLTVLLLIFIIGYLLQSIFEKAGEEINGHFVQNFAYGILYFIGLPIIALFSIVIIIGIPIGLVLLNLYVLSILFSYVVSSLALAYGFNHRYQKNWNKWQIILLAIVIFPFLKLLSIIPLVGILCMIIIVATVFGALIKPCVASFRSQFFNKEIS